jgi:N-acetyl-alpha-D-muramate 1-phosphate uridylyltransferase
MNTLIILAGGLATRLYPITRTIPKSLVEVNGKPFIHWQLNLLRKSGYENIVICAGFLGEQIQEFLEKSDSYGMNIQYSYDGTTKLGTGGAIVKAAKNIESHFSVLYGDSYLPINYKLIESKFLKSGRKSLITVFKNQNLEHSNNIEFDGTNIIEYSKTNPTQRMTHIDYGFSCYKSEIFDDFIVGEYLDLGQVMSQLVKKGEAVSFVAARKYHEVGSFQGISDFESYLKGSRR